MRVRFCILGLRIAFIMHTDPCRVFYVCSRVGGSGKYVWMVDVRSVYKVGVVCGFYNNDTSLFGFIGHIICFVTVLLDISRC